MTLTFERQQRIPSRDPFIDRRCCCIGVMIVISADLVLLILIILLLIMSVVPHGAADLLMALGACLLLQDTVPRQRPAFALGTSVQHSF